MNILFLIGGIFIGSVIILFGKNFFNKKLIKENKNLKFCWEQDKQKIHDIQILLKMAENNFKLIKKYQNIDIQTQGKIFEFEKKLLDYKKIIKNFNNEENKI